MRERQPCVYILASGFYGTLYVGVTSTLVGRVMQHREVRFGGFTTEYAVTRVAWYAIADTGRCDRAGKAHQTPATRLEDRADRA
ncbi:MULTISPECIES: GIY-YIG nuclease family protein [unclassified Sphingomonas]|mgnify:CR=1 FL=1|jgi:putative endonuclease|uniref:GIY-YIG nuclease family protein n=1 Tax=unclassified Sphingomonas TaxID=196159 RepID=UPI000A621DD3